MLAEAKGIKRIILAVGYTDLRKCSLVGTYHLHPHSDILSGVVCALLF